MNILDIQNVTKAYSSKVAVKEVSFSVPEGAVFGLLGPNGAGKTSLIRMITRITAPDGGEILFRGVPLRDEHQRYIGYMPEERGLYKKMPVQEQAEYLLTLKGMAPADARQAASYWLDRLELGAWRKKKADELSKGMQQKLQFIITVAHRPPLLILDEPFSGLDPLNAQIIEDIIAELRREGSTVIFSTHRMEQVEQMCERIVLIANGRVLLKGDESVRAIRRRYHKGEYVVEAEGGLTGLALPEGVQALERSEHRLRLRLAPGQQPRQLVGWLNDQAELTHFELHLPTLREIFIDLVAADKSGQFAQAEPMPATPALA